VRPAIRANPPHTTSMTLTRCALLLPVLCAADIRSLRVKAAAHRGHLHAGVSCSSCVDARCFDTRCQGVSSKQWELGSSGVVRGVHDLCNKPCSLAARCWVLTVVSIVTVVCCLPTICCGEQHADSSSPLCPEAFPQRVARKLLSGTHDMSTRWTWFPSCVCSIFAAVLWDSNGSQLLLLDALVTRPCSEKSSTSAGAAWWCAVKFACLVVEFQSRAWSVGKLGWRW
jgi:hypothetical protein